MIFEMIIIPIGFIIGVYWYHFHLKLFWQSVQAFKLMNEMPPLGKPPKGLEDVIKSALKKQQDAEEDDLEAGMYQ